MTTGRTTPDYDFFAGTAPPAPPAAGGQFAAAAPVNQFGSPTVNQFGTATSAFGPGVGGAAPQPVPSSAGVRVPTWVWRVAVSLLVAVVLGAFGLGRFAGLFDSDLEPPATLDGLTRVEDDQTTQLVEAMAGMLSFSGLEDGDLTAALYTDGVAPGAFLFAFREHTPPEAARSQLSQHGSVVDVGADTLCTTATAAAITMCLRSADDLTVVVMRSGASDAFQVAPVMNEAWGAF